MGDIKTNPFIKNEFSKSFNNPSIANYTGIGFKMQKYKIGTLEPFLAFKSSNTDISTFGELKYTSPEIADTNLKFESRSRVIASKANGENDINLTVTQRFAGKYSGEITKNVGFYEIFGGNSSIQKGKVTKFTPTSISGLDFKLDKNMSMYVELELTKPYDIETNTWGKVNSGGYLGLKYTF